MLAAVLFLLPSNICGSKEIKNSSIETENQPNIDVSVGLDYDDKTSEPAVKTVVPLSPLCGDKQMSAAYTCYCGDRTLSGYTDLSNGDYHCCVPPSADGQDQCKYTAPIFETWSDVRCENGEVRHKTEPCHLNCWNSYRQSGKLWKTATLYCQKEEYCLPLDQMCS